MEVLVQECNSKDAILHVVDTSQSACGVFGRHDVSRENRLLSEAVCRHLGVPVEGMRDFYWPCR